VLNRYENSASLADHFLEIGWSMMTHFPRTLGELGIEARFFDARKGAIIFLFHF
jgi:hypothetical protein